MIALKNGVNPSGLAPQTLLVILVAKDCFADRGYDMTITSLNDSNHADTSRHYQGMAIDFRTRHLPNHAIAREITKEMQERLGRHFMVLFEENHIHVSYKPRKP